MNREEKKLLDALVSRRGFIGASASATLAALAGGSPAALWAQSEKPKPTADTIILLWMAGGMAQTETFDPKRPAEFQTGLAAKDVLSTFRPIDTAVDHIKISEGLERIARGDGSRNADPFLSSRRPGIHSAFAASISLAHRLRSAADGGDAAHRRGDRQDAGSKNPDVPAFIDIGQNLEIGGESAAVKAFHTAGFLGTDYGPFLITNPLDADRACGRMRNWATLVLPRRYELFQKLAAESPVAQFGGEYQRDALKRSRGCGASAARIRHRPRRSICRSSRSRVTTSTTPDPSDWAACWRGGSPKRARDSSK